VSQREIEQRFEATRKDFQPEMAAIRWIVVASEEEGRKVIARLGQGEPFAELAKTASIEPVSAKKGGAVGAVRPDKIPAELSVVVFAKDAKPGLITRPVEVVNAIPFYGPPGWYVVAIDEIVRQGETTLETWRPVIETKLRKEKAVSLLEERLATRRKKAKIWIERDLASLIVPAESAAEPAPTP
jgi:parvulin-like peptidyl-prolyl isomerase